MEKLSSLFTKNDWGKLETNEKLFALGKPAKNVIIVPEFEFDKNGEVVDTFKHLRITTTKQAKEYDEKYAKVMDILKEKYPNLSRVRRIFTASLKKSIRELTCNCMETNSGKILCGGKTSNAIIAANIKGTGSQDTVHGFLRTVNSYDGRQVVLPKVEKPNSAIMREFRRNKSGYYVPEITNRGLVVVPLAGSKTTFDSKCEAFSSADVTREQVIEYFKAPFGDKEVNVDFDLLAKLSSDTYSAIGTENFLPRLSLMMDYVTQSYPFSFENMKEDKPKKPENVELKRKIDEMFAVPAMLPEANVQTLIDEERTRMTTKDAIEPNDEKLKLIKLIHEKVEREKLLSGEKEKSEQVGEKLGGMPELDVDAYNAQVERERAQKEEQIADKTPQLVEKDESTQPIVSKDEYGKTHITFNINNINIFRGWKSKKSKDKQLVSVPFSESPIINVTTGKSISKSPVVVLREEEIKESEKD